MERLSYDSGALGAEEVEVAVEYCGLCHSDQSMIDNAWAALLGTLRGKGRLHFVGIVPNVIPVHVFNLIQQQKSLSGLPVGSPKTMATRLEFCARHQILPQLEHFPMSQVNAASDHLRSGKAR